MADRPQRVKTTRTQVDQMMPWILPTAGPDSEISSMRFQTEEQAREMAQRLYLDPETVYHCQDD